VVQTSRIPSEQFLIGAFTFLYAFLKKKQDGFFLKLMLFHRTIKRQAIPKTSSFITAATNPIAKRQSAHVS
jgi:hypothetical protein